MAAWASPGVLKRMSEAERVDSCIIRLARVSMGTRFELMLCGTDPDYLGDVGHLALDEVERLESQLSHYRSDSDVCDLNTWAQYRPVIVEPGLFNLLQLAVRLSDTTEGAFDCTAGPLVKCWGFFRGRGRMPQEADIAEARRRVGSDLLELDAAARTVRFQEEGVEVHLGAIGKGYAVDAIVAILREYNVSAALVHGGGSTIYGLGAPPGEEAWEIGIRDPRAEARRLGVVRLKDRAFSTSGDYEQFFEANGRRYSHILDPRTGHPAQGLWSAAISAESATLTDALSTAAFVLGTDGTRSLLNRYPGAGAVLIPDPGAGAIAGADVQARVLVFGDVDVVLADSSTTDQENTEDE